MLIQIGVSICDRLPSFSNIHSFIILKTYEIRLDTIHFHSPEGDTALLRDSAAASADFAHLSFCVYMLTGLPANNKSGLDIIMIAIFDIVVLAAFSQWK